jgi:hypothetical protein
MPQQRHALASLRPDLSASGRTGLPGRDESKAEDANDERDDFPKNHTLHKKDRQGDDLLLFLIGGRRRDRRRCARPMRKSRSARRGEVYDLIPDSLDTTHTLGLGAPLLIKSSHDLLHTRAALEGESAKAPVWNTTQSEYRPYLSLPCLDHIFGRVLHAFTPTRPWPIVARPRKAAPP